MVLHDRLCDCVDLSNFLLALQILLICLTICMYTVFGLFAKYRYVDYHIGSLVLCCVYINGYI